MLLSVTTDPSVDLLHFPLDVEQVSLGKLPRVKLAVTNEFRASMDIPVILYADPSLSRLSGVVLNELRLAFNALKLALCYW